jgi:hypothetical protein
MPVAVRAHAFCVDGVCVSVCLCVCVVQPSYVGFENTRRSSSVPTATASKTGRRVSDRIRRRCITPMPIQSPPCTHLSICCMYAHVYTCVRACLCMCAHGCSCMWLCLCVLAIRIVAGRRSLRRCRCGRGGPTSSGIVSTSWRRACARTSWWRDWCRGASSASDT